MIKEVSIWDLDGSEVGKVSLGEPGLPIEGKRGLMSESGVFYKGAGCTYKGHFQSELCNRLLGGSSVPDVEVVGSSGMDYVGELVENPNWKGKFGIFLYKYQPYFSDLIGSCGKKELKILDNCSLPFSGVDVLDYLNMGDEMYVFKLKYMDSKEGSIEQGTVEKLIKQIIEGKYICPYDKDLYRDMDCEGRIHDVADWLEVSRDGLDTKAMQEKFGTVYALVRSISKHNGFLFRDLQKKIGLPYTGTEVDSVALALAYTVGYSKSWDSVIKSYDFTRAGELQRFMVKYLFSNQMCCGLEFPIVAEEVRKSTIVNFYKQCRTWRF